MGILKTTEVHNHSTEIVERVRNPYSWELPSPVRIEVPVPMILNDATYVTVMGLLKSASDWYEHHADEVVIKTGADIKKVEQFRAISMEYKLHATCLSLATCTAYIAPTGDDVPDAIESITEGVL